MAVSLKAHVGGVVMDDGLAKGDLFGALVDVPLPELARRRLQTG